MSRLSPMIQKNKDQNLGNQHVAQTTKGRTPMSSAPLSKLSWLIPSYRCRRGSNRRGSSSHQAGTSNTRRHRRCRSRCCSRTGHCTATGPSGDCERATGSVAGHPGLPCGCGWPNDQPSAVTAVAAMTAVATMPAMPTVTATMSTTATATGQSLFAEAKSKDQGCNEGRHKLPTASRLHVVLCRNFFGRQGFGFCSFMAGFPFRVVQPFRFPSPPGKTATRKGTNRNGGNF